MGGRHDAGDRCADRLVHGDLRPVLRSCRRVDTTEAAGGARGGSDPARRPILVRVRVPRPIRAAGLALHPRPSLPGVPAAGGRRQASRRTSGLDARSRRVARRSDVPDEPRAAPAFAARDADRRSGTAHHPGTRLLRFPGAPRGSRPLRAEPLAPASSRPALGAADAPGSRGPHGGGVRRPHRGGTRLSLARARAPEPAESRSPTSSSS